MILFWIFFAIDALIALIILGFFFIGIADGTVSGFNIGLWLILLLVSVGLLVGGYYLKSIGHLSLAKTLLGIVAVPVALAFIYFIGFVASNPRWN